MGNKGSSYIEIIICMSLISIIGLSLAGGFNIVLLNNKFTKENYYANLAAENLLNVTQSQIETNNLLEILLMKNEYFYEDKFNFVVRINKVEHDLTIANEVTDEINYDNEDVLPIETKIYCDNNSLFGCVSENAKPSYLITVDVFNKSHKFLKRLSEIY